MKSYIALVPGIIAVIHLLFSRNIAKTFVYIFLPTLLLLPNIFYINIPGFPNLTFQQITMLPLLAALVLTLKAFKWNWSFTDLLVLLYVFLTVLSEYVNTGFDEQPQGGILWINLLGKNIFAILIPYYLAKKLIYENDLSVQCAKVIVVCMVANIIICAYEWRFVINLHIEPLYFFFPDAMTQNRWIPFYRYGLVRLSGPFYYPILFGVMAVSALALNHWLTKNKRWSRLFIFNRGHIFSFILIVGTILAFSRGPLLGFIVGWVFLSLGYSRHRGAAILLRLAVLAVLGIVLFYAILHYAGMSKSVYETALAQTAAYRIDLVMKYFKHVMEKPWLGWGFITWPKVERLASIDNHYLWLMMKHGLLTTGVFLYLLLHQSVRLFLVGMKNKFIALFFSFFATLFSPLRRSKSKLSHKVVDKEVRSFAFCLLSLYVIIAVSLSTVYLGMQTETFLYIILGWSESFLQSTQKRLGAPKSIGTHHHPVWEEAVAWH